MKIIVACCAALLLVVAVVSATPCLVICDVGSSGTDCEVLKDATNPDEPGVSCKSKGFTAIGKFASQDTASMVVKEMFTTANQGCLQAYAQVAKCPVKLFATAGFRTLLWTGASMDKAKWFCAEHAAATKASGSPKCEFKVIDGVGESMLGAAAAIAFEAKVANADISAGLQMLECGGASCQQIQCAKGASYTKSTSLVEMGARVFGPIDHSAMKTLIGRDQQCFGVSQNGDAPDRMTRNVCRKSIQLGVKLFAEAPVTTGRTGATKGMIVTGQNEERPETLGNRSCYQAKNIPNGCILTETSPGTPTWNAACGCKMTKTENGKITQQYPDLKDVFTGKDQYGGPVTDKNKRCIIGVATISNQLEAFEEVYDILDKDYQETGNAGGVEPAPKGKKGAIKFGHSLNLYNANTQKHKLPTLLISSGFLMNLKGIKDGKTKTCMTPLEFTKILNGAYQHETTETSDHSCKAPSSINTVWALLVKMNLADYKKGKMPVIKSHIKCIAVIKNPLPKAMYKFGMFESIRNYNVDAIQEDKLWKVGASNKQQQQATPNKKNNQQKTTAQTKAPLKVTNKKQGAAPKKVTKVQGNKKKKMF